MKRCYDCNFPHRRLLQVRKYRLAEIKPNGITATINSLRKTRRNYDSHN